MSDYDDFLHALRYGAGAGFFGGLYQQATPNTFRLKPEPREGYVDARRADTCIPVITVLR
ncbi:hypothetical protein SEA_CHEETO1_54 [Microbacterium phage Cheeto1]|nr:hypothetical protein SEA_CHEETO1_54 [Microbacterium phage Cheeto1]